MADHLLIIGERRGLAWVLDHEKMAFPPARAAEAVSALAEGDKLLIYTTRGCFHNPVRDRGRIMGDAVVRTSVTRRRTPLILGAKEFSHECKIEIVSLAPFRSGVELQPLVARLEAFRDAASWAVRVRRALLTLSHRDAVCLRHELRKVASAEISDALLTYRLPVARGAVRTQVGQRQTPNAQRA